MSRAGRMELQERLAGIRNIIFDLGGVLYGVDYEAVERAMTALQDRTADVPAYSRARQADCITLYETGSIPKEEFRRQLRRDYGIRSDADDGEIDDAWCAILTGVYPGRVDLLQQLRGRYRLALLSNTNEIHLDTVRRECPDLLDQFDGCFYSHEVRLRKPQSEMFSHVLAAMEFLPEETLFLDDSPQHLHAAGELGIHTVWVQHPDVVELVAGLLLEQRP